MKNMKTTFAPFHLVQVSFSSAPSEHYGHVIWHVFNNRRQLVALVSLNTKTWRMTDWIILFRQSHEVDMKYN